MAAPDRLILEGREQTETGLVLTPRWNQLPRCPVCTRADGSRHREHTRTLRDWPGPGQPVLSLDLDPVTNPTLPLPPPALAIEQAPVRNLLLGLLPARALSPLSLPTFLGCLSLGT
jgi:hypothetical protein